MKELSPEELAIIVKIVEGQKELGLVSLAKEFYSDELMIDEEKYFKLNLPTSEATFKSGNGEGIWVYPLTDSDEMIYNKGISGETFDCIVMNDCINYPIQCASIIKGRNTGSDARPIIDYDWFDKTIKLATNGETSLKYMLEN
jgi:hypothetical protein